MPTPYGNITTREQWNQPPAEPAQPEEPKEEPKKEEE